jgi:hypothetical protein
MGVVGFRRWIENQNCTRMINTPVVAPAPVSDDDGATGAAKPNGLRPAMQHLMFDMNSLIHNAFDRSNPSAAVLRKHLFANLNKILAWFPPSHTLDVMFDGPSPLSKLKTQRERRRKYPDPSTGHNGKGEPPLCEAMLTTGSTLMMELEMEVEAFFLAKVQSGAVKAPAFFFSGCRVPGEGETKITERIIAIANLPSADATAAAPPGDATGGAAAVGSSYNIDDNFCIIGNDSDLILNCIGLTLYHNYFVVNPFSFLMIAVGDVILSWTRPQRGNLAPSQLPGVRTDFVFLMLFAGCDHFPGVEDKAVTFWHTYRKLRGTPAHANSRLVRTYQGRLQLNGAFLRDVISPVEKLSHRDRKKQGGSGGGKYQQARAKHENQKKNKVTQDSGVNLITGVLWMMTTVVTGQCPDYQYYFRGDAPTIHSVRAAALQASLGSLGSPMSRELPLAPLEVFVAVMTNLKWMPKIVRECVLRRGLTKLTAVDSVGFVTKTVADVFASIDPREFSATEKLLLTFDVPHLHLRSEGGVRMTPVGVPSVMETLAAEDAAGGAEVLAPRPVREALPSCQAVMAFHPDAVAAAELRFYVPVEHMWQTVVVHRAKPAAAKKAAADSESGGESGDDAAAVVDAVHIDPTAE